MKSLFIYLYGEYQCLNVFKADISVFKDMRKNHNIVAELYEKWNKIETTNAKKYCPNILHYSDYKGITKPEKVEIFDENNNMLHSQNIGDMKQLTDYTEKNFYKVVMKNTGCDFRETYELDINKKEFLWKNIPIGLIYGGYLGKGVLEFRIEFFDKISGERKIPELPFINSLIYFDCTKFWDDNISKPIINCMSYGLWRTQKIMGKYETNYEPLKTFSSEKLKVSLMRISKNKRLGDFYSFPIEESYWGS